MATAVNASNSQACTVGTEHTLATVTAAGNYQAQFDIPAAATAADIFELNIYQKLAGSGDTATLAEKLIVRGRAVAHRRILDPVVSPVELQLRIKQLAGTSRTVPWARPTARAGSSTAASHPMSATPGRAAAGRRYRAAPRSAFPR